MYKKFYIENCQELLRENKIQINEKIYNAHEF